MQKLQREFDISVPQALNGLVNVDFGKHVSGSNSSCHAKNADFFRRTEEFRFFAVHNDNLPETKRFVEPDRSDVLTRFIAQSRAVAHHDFSTLMLFYRRLSHADESVSHLLALWRMTFEDAPTAVTYTGDPTGPPPKTTPCPSITAPAGKIVQSESTPPESNTADLAVPEGSSPDMIALGDRIYHGQVGGATCTGCHGANGTGTPLGPDLTK